ncbi:MAG: phosphate signaling complex protein PhoU [Oscillospiraceae bacterium]|nr:phosphate signaling complex protein PhoU [Oscillospiraceae bacterium]
MRNRFDMQLAELHRELIAMGALCEEAIAGCFKYLTENDESICDNVLETDRQIDRKEREIEALCMKLLLQQQPVARDLRVVSSALKIISDMERIGDQASDIAEIVQYVHGAGLKAETHIADMARATIQMVTDSIESFVNNDISLANEVIRHDDVVDALFCDIKNELIQTFQAEHEDSAEVLLDMLMIAKYFERIGDHAENIAEWVIYSITGKHADFEI